MVYLEKKNLHTVTVGNYVTSVNGMIHPDRIMVEHDFLYMLDGEMEVWEDEIPYVLKNDDLLILTAGRHHYGKKLCTAENRHMYIHVVPSPAEEVSNISSVPPAQGASLFSCPSLVHCAAAPQIRQNMQEMIFVLLSHSSERDTRLSLLFSLLLCELSELTISTEPKTSPDPMVDSIMRRIHSTPQHFFSAQEIASDYHICNRTLNNHFLKSCGRTFPAFQMDTKLQMVQQFLLAQPYTKLYEAAVNYGFYDEFHLSKAFKKKYGISPSQYRQRHKV